MRLSPLDDGGLPSIPEGRPAAALPPVRESSRSPRLSPRGPSPSQSSPYAGPQSLGEAHFSMMSISMHGLHGEPHSGAVVSE